jgi:hypothetical protein
LPFEGFGVRLGREVEAGEVSRAVTLVPLAMPVLRPCTSWYIQPTPHHHLGQAIAQTASRNRYIYPMREFRLSILLDTVAVDGAAHQEIEARPAAVGKRPPTQKKARGVRG